MISLILKNMSFIYFPIDWHDFAFRNFELIIMILNIKQNQYKFKSFGTGGTKGIPNFRLEILKF